MLHNSPMTTQKLKCLGYRERERDKERECLPPIIIVSTAARMHSVQVEVYASISPKAELKVHVFLNVAHQQTCKVVTSVSSVKINVFSSDVLMNFIHSLCRGRTDRDIL